MWLLDLAVSLRPDPSGRFTHRGDVGGWVRNRRPVDTPKSDTQVSGDFWITVDRFLGCDLFLRAIEVDLQLGDYRLWARRKLKTLDLITFAIEVPGLLRHNGRVVAKLKLQISILVVLDYLRRLNSPSADRQF